MSSDYDTNGDEGDDKFRGKYGETLDFDLLSAWIKILGVQQYMDWYTSHHFIVFATIWYELEESSIDRCPVTVVL